MKIDDKLYQIKEYEIHEYKAFLYGLQMMLEEGKYTAKQAAEAIKDVKVTINDEMGRQLAAYRNSR